MPADFSVSDHGTVTLLHLESDAAEAWAAEYLPPDVMRWGDAVVVEPRYLLPIVAGMLDDGLTQERSAAQ